MMGNIYSKIITNQFITNPYCLISPTYHGQKYLPKMHRENVVYNPLLKNFPYMFPNA